MENTVFQTDVYTSTEMFQFIVTYIFVQFLKTIYLFPVKALSVICSLADTKFSALV